MINPSQPQNPAPDSVSSGGATPHEQSQWIIRTISEFTSRVGVLEELQKSTHSELVELTKGLSALHRELSTSTSLIGVVDRDLQKVQSSLVGIQQSIADVQQGLGRATPKLESLQEGIQDVKSSVSQIANDVSKIPELTLYARGGVAMVLIFLGLCGWTANQLYVLNKASGIADTRLESSSRQVEAIHVRLAASESQNKAVLEKLDQIIANSESKTASNSN